MPRKNCNARRIYRPEDYFYGHIPRGRHFSQIKTAGESIVREHRETMNDERRTMNEKPRSTFQPYRILPQPQPSFLKIVFNRINWPRLIDIAFAGLAILAIVAIIGIIFFGPAPTKEILR